MSFNIVNTTCCRGALDVRSCNLFRGRGRIFKCKTSHSNVPRSSRIRYPRGPGRFWCHCRTAYSAAFVAAGSVGMAVGPFISAMLTKVDFTIVGVRFNGLTNPGWVMFVLWVVVGFLLFTVFQASGSHAYAFGACTVPGKPFQFHDHNLIRRAFSRPPLPPPPLEPMFPPHL